MKNITELIQENIIDTIAINESWDVRAQVGAILEVELRDDGNFYWVDEDDYPDMKNWEIRKSKNGRGFVIKIGEISRLRK